MCHYSDILGEGNILVLQALTALSIAASIAFWAWLYRKHGVWLERYAAPITMWVLFGTLDILITAKGTSADPLREGNPLARSIFLESGYLGPVIASILWIALWSSVVLLINKKIRGRLAAFLSLAVFYSLATGHLFGFSSWFLPLCGISKAYLAALPELPRLTKIIFAGSTLAMIHRSLFPDKDRE